MTTIALVRHGRTQWNEEQRIQGRTNLALTARGRDDILQLASFVSLMNPAVIYTSPVARALESARLLMQDCQRALVEEESFTELDVGEWCGKRGGELTNTAEWSEYISDPSIFTPPSGESIQNMNVRVIHAIERIIAVHPHERILIVTHGDCIRAAICHYIGLPLKCMHSLQVDLGSISVLSIEAERSILLGLNHPFSWPSDRGA
jgi:probable phosphoglycerate mutase